MIKHVPPLIAPKHFTEHTPESWHSYVKGLKDAPAEKKGSGLFFSWTKTGKPSLRITRDPKIVTQGEIEELARANDCPIATLYIIAKQKATIVKPAPHRGGKKEKRNDKETK